MSISVEQRILAEQPQGTEFFQDAVAAYGREGAQQVCESVFEGVRIASEHVPYYMPATRIGLAVSSSSDLDDIGVLAVASSRARNIRLMLGAGAEVQQIASIMPAIMVHESTHLAHCKVNPEVYTSSTLLSIMLREGVALKAEYSLDEENYIPENLYNIPLENVELARQISDILVEAVCNPEVVTMRQKLEFLRGHVENFPLKGYTVGHYAVSIMALQHGFDLKRLLTVSLSEFQEFVETQL